MKTTKFIVLATFLSLFSCGIDPEADNPFSFGLGETAAIGFTSEEGFLADMEYQECKATVTDDTVTVKQTFKITPRENKSLTITEDDFHLFFAYDPTGTTEIGHLCDPVLTRENNTIDFFNHPISTEQTIYVYYTAEKRENVDYDTVGIMVYIFPHRDYCFIN